MRSLKFELTIHNMGLNDNVASSLPAYELEMEEENDGNLTTFSNNTIEIHIDRILYPDYSQIPEIRSIFVVLFLIECVLGILGNIFVCVTVWRNKVMHSPVNYYIVNLGVCDFLVGAFVLPVKLFELVADAEMNMLNDRLCTAVRFLESIVVFASVLTLVAICTERYYAVVYPVHSRVHLTDNRIRRVLHAVWIVPCIVAAPTLWPANATKQHLFSELGEIRRLTCFDGFSEGFRRNYFIFLFVFMYCIPLIFIGVTCLSITRVLMKKIPVQPSPDPRTISLERGRRKVAKMVLVIVLSFLVCWTPYFVVSMVTQLQSENFLQHGQFFFTMLCINLLCFTNSCVNPFVYFTMSTRFRKGFLIVLRSMTCKKKAPNYSVEHSMSTLRCMSQGRYVNGQIQQSVRYPRDCMEPHRGCSNEERSDSEGRGDVIRCLQNSQPPPTASTPGSIRVHMVPGQSESRLRRNPTILLEFHHCGNPSCCSQMIPLGDLTGSGTQT